VLSFDPFKQFFSINQPHDYENLSSLFIVVRFQVLDYIWVIHFLHRFNLFALFGFCLGQDIDDYWIAVENVAAN